jgi:hypothetical protein
MTANILLLAIAGTTALLAAAAVGVPVTSDPVREVALLARR